MKILLVDDHQMVRLGLKSYLELQDDIAEVSEAVNGKEGVEQALASRPDVIIMDICLRLPALKKFFVPSKKWPRENLPLKQRSARKWNIIVTILSSMRI